MFVGNMDGASASATEEIFSGFSSRYHIPAPISAAGGGIGIDTSEFACDNINESEYYEEQLLRHVIELSLNDHKKPPPVPPTTEKVGDKVSDDQSNDKQTVSLV